MARKINEDANNSSYIIGYRSIGIYELEELLKGNTIKGTYPISKEKQVELKNKIRGYVICFYSTPRFWRDKQHRFFIKCKFKKEEVLGTGVGTYYAAKNLKDVWSGRRGDKEWRFEEFYVRRYDYKNIEALVYSDNLKRAKYSNPDVSHPYFDMFNKDHQKVLDDKRLKLNIPVQAIPIREDMYIGESLSLKESPKYKDLVKLDDWTWKYKDRVIIGYNEYGKYYFVSEPSELDWMYAETIGSRTALKDLLNSIDRELEKMDNEIIDEVWDRGRVIEEDLKEDYEEFYYRGYDSRYGVLDDRNNSLYTWVTDDIDYAYEYAKDNKYGKIAKIEIYCEPEELTDAITLDSNYEYDFDYLDPSDDFFKEEVLDKGFVGYTFEIPESEYDPFCICISKDCCKVIDDDVKVDFNESLKEDKESYQSYKKRLQNVKSQEELKKVWNIIKSSINQLDDKEADKLCALYKRLSKTDIDVTEDWQDYKYEDEEDYEEQTKQGIKTAKMQKRWEKRIDDTQGDWFEGKINKVEYIKSLEDIKSGLQDLDDDSYLVKHLIEECDTFIRVMKDEIKADNFREDVEEDKIHTRWTDRLVKGIGDIHSKGGSKKDIIEFVKEIRQTMLTDYDGDRAGSGAYKVVDLCDDLLTLIFRDISQEEQALNEARDYESEYNITPVDKKKIIQWWKDIKDYFDEYHTDYDLDLSTIDSDDIDGWFISMNDELQDLVGEKQNEGALELLRRGKSLYNKYAYSKFNYGVKEEYSLPKGKMITNSNGVSFYQRGNKYYRNTGWLEKEITKDEFDKAINEINNTQFDDIDEFLKKSSRDLNEEIKVNDTLNPLLFQDNKLKPEVKEKINDIVDEFLKGLQEDNIQINVDDIELVGSNVNYNYTKDSDLDVHIIANVTNCPGELYPLLYSAYRSIWNKNIDIDFYGIPVELYVDTENQPKSNGIYSVTRDEWIKEPVKEDIPDYDKEEFERQFKELEDKYFNLIEQ